MKLLGVFAHADDAEIWAGGTLLKHQRSGDETAIALFPGEDVQRREEARVGGLILRADVHMLAGAVETQDPLCEDALSHLLKILQPDLVVTHWHQDFHPHHRFVFEVVNRALIPVRIATGKPRVLYGCDTYHSLGMSGVFQPHHYVDVTEVWEQKCKAIKAHTSQVPDMWEAMISNQARLHGARIGSTYAEAFIQIPILGRCRPDDRLPA